MSLVQGTMLQLPLCFAISRLETLLAAAQNMKMRLFLLLAVVVVTKSSPVWNPEPTQTCPNIAAQKSLQLEQVAGDWRLAYLFLSQVDEGVDEEDSCVVTSVVPSHDSTGLELSLFIDTLRADHVDRTAAQFPADLISPGEWKIHTPLSSGGYVNARVIQANQDHLVVTFCGQKPPEFVDNDIGQQGSQEAPLDWRALFDDSRRAKRSAENSATRFDWKSALYKEKKHEDSVGNDEVHMWTAILVKHNDISALKFVEYAAVLMKHGFDVTQGELVSFGKCPVGRPHKDPL